MENILPYKPLMTLYFSSNEAFRRLKAIAKKENFTPQIVGLETSEGFSLKTKYHLEFDDWTEVIEPLIDFYKNLIDEFENRNAFISNKAYREM